MVDAATTSEAVGFITLMQELKRKLRSWEQRVEVFRAGEKILDRQRFQFPASWVYVDNVEGEWGAFNEIVKRKESSVQTQIGTLQMQIVAEDRAVEQKTAELLQVWEKEKPVQVWYFIHTLTTTFKLGESLPKGGSLSSVCAYALYTYVGYFVCVQPAAYRHMFVPSLRETCVQRMLPTCSPSSRASSLDSRKTGTTSSKPKRPWS